MALVGIPDNFDLPQHLRFARTFYGSIQEFSLSPAWEMTDNFGFGSIGTRIYPPLVYVSTAFFYTLAGDWYDTLWLTIFFWMLMSCFGMYFLVKEWAKPEIAALAAVVYAFAPYHLTQVYQAFLLAEFTASAILPFCFLFAYRLSKSGKYTDILLFAFFYSLLILAHIPSTMIGTLCLGVFCLLLLERQTLVRSVKGFALAFTLSFGMTAFYVVRLLSEANWVKHNSEKFYASGFYDYSTYLFPLYINGADRYIEKLYWAYDLIIIATLFLFFPLLLQLIFRVMPRSEGHRYFYALIGTGIFSFFMLTIPSSFIWDNISILQKIQFPWRWLSITSLIGSVLFSLSVCSLYRSKKLLSRVPAYLLAISVTTVLLFDLTQLIIPSSAVPRAEFAEKVGRIDEEAACDCWWPIWAKEEAFENKDRLTTGGRAFAISEWENTERRFNVQPGEATNARIATFYYPYWKAEVNGAPVEVGMNDDGTILIPLRAEDAAVRLYFSEPAFLDVAKGISLLAWLSMFASIVAVYRKQKRTESDHAPIP